MESLAAQRGGSEPGSSRRSGSRSSVGVVAAGQEPLHLRAELVRGGQLPTHRRRPLVPLGDHGVVLALQGGHHLRDLLRALDLLGDLALGPLGGGRQRRGGQVEARRDRQVVDQHAGGLRVLGARQVVRHVHGEAHRRVPRLAEPVLDERHRAAGHLGGGEQRLVALGQLRPGAVHRHPDGAGVRHGHRDPRQVHHEPDVQRPDELLDGGREPLPLRVRLRARSAAGSRCPRSRSARRRPAPVPCSAPSGRSRSAAGDAGSGSRRAGRRRSAPPAARTPTRASSRPPAGPPRLRRRTRRAPSPAQDRPAPGRPAPTGTALRDPARSHLRSAARAARLPPRPSRERESARTASPIGAHMTHHGRPWVV